MLVIISYLKMLSGLNENKKIKKNYVKNYQKKDEIIDVVFKDMYWRICSKSTDLFGWGLIFLLNIFSLLIKMDEILL